MRPSLETAVRAFDFAGWILVAALVIGAICTVVIVFMGIVKEEYWDKSREAAKVQVAQLESETAKAQADLEKAKADVEKAHADIANANKAIAEARTAAVQAVAETAKANERTAELKLALEREIAARQPRTISTENRTKIITHLATAAPKGPIVVIWKLFDEEAEQFGKQVISLLNAAGFEATEGHGPMGFSERGQWIIVRDLPKLQTTPNAVGAIQGAFRDILNLDFNGVQRKDPFPDLGEVVIAIGAKS